MKTVKLGDVCDFKPAKSLVKTKITDDTMVSFSPMEQLPIGKKYFTPEQSKKLTEVYSSYVYFEDNDVIYAKITPCFENGKMSIAKGLKNGVGFGSSEFVPIRCSDKILPEYLYYFLLKPSFIEYGSQNMRGASGHKRVPDEITIELLIPLPSLEEQRRVVERLDAAFEKIDRAIELTEKNIKQSELLFSSGIEQIFSNKNMANWKSYKVKEIGNVQTGTTPKTSIKENYGNYIPFIKPGDFRVDGILNYENDALSKNGLKVGRFIPKNSVLMVCIGATITKTAVTTRDVSCNQQINAVSLPDATTAKFVYYQMITKKFKEKILNEAPKTTLPIINKGNWSALTVGFPETTEIENVVKNLDSLLNVSINLSEMYKNKLYKLSELKKSLLTQTFEQGGVK